MTDEQFEQQQALYDDAWAKGLGQGKKHRGNHEINVAFLDRIHVLARGQRMLEIGCGAGEMVNELASRGHDIVGTDISRVAIEHGKREHPHLRLEVQPAESLPFDDRTFDVVLSFDLLEHIAEVDRHVSEVSRVVKPGGYYLLQTPNLLSNATYETLTHRSFKWKRHHPSLHTPGQLRRRLMKHGLSARFVKMNPINDFMLAKLRRFGPLASLARFVDFEKLPLHLQTNLYVVAKKT